MNARGMFFGRAGFFGLWLLSLTLLLAGCGGGSSSGGGGAFVDEPVVPGKISLDASRSTLPLNVENLEPRIGGPFTATFFVSARNDNGPIEGEFGCVLVGDSVDRASLYYLDGSDRDFVEDPVTGDVAVDPTTGSPIRAAYRSITLDSNSGAASFHLNSETQPGTATVRCTITDPATDVRLAAERSIEIGASTGSGDPTEILLMPREGVVFEQLLNRPTTDTVNVVLLDENRGTVRDPRLGANNVLVEIVSGPDAGEYLVGRNAAGNTLRGQALPLRTTGGVAEFQVVSGFASGPILIQATADQADNNIDNVLREPVYGGAVVVVTSTGDGGPLNIISDESLPTAQRTFPYAVVLEASGGVPPYSWSLTGGDLPIGLNLSPSGAITGRPQQLGESCFLATVTDSRSPSPNQAGPQRFCIDVDGDPPPPAALRIITTRLADGTAGQGYAAILGASGGELPYNWFLDFDGGTSANNQVGIQLSPSGVLSWSNPREGSYSLGVSVLSSDGQQAAQLLNLSVRPGENGPTPDPGTLAQVSLVGSDADLASGSVSNLALVLSEPAQQTVRVRLFLTGDTSQFNVPNEIEIPQGTSSVAVAVEAIPGALSGSRVELRLASGPGYEISGGGPVIFTVNDALSDLPDAELSGAGASGLAVDDVVTFSVSIRPPADREIEVRVLATGVNVQNRFSVPASVTVPVGEATQEFVVTVLPGDVRGEAKIELTSGLGYSVSSITSNSFTLETTE